MAWGELGCRKERLTGVFLVALTLVNAAMVLRIAPLLRRGYQDFTAFYAGAEIVRGGQAARLYDVTPQYQLQRQFAPNVRIRQAALPYNHPPFEALLFVPFTYLNYLPAYLLWTFLNANMLALSLRIVRKTFAEVGRLSPVFVILAAFGFVPVVNGLVQGQDSVLLLLLLTLSFASLEESRDVIAGVALGAGLFKFHFVLPLTLVLAVRRPRLLLGFTPVAAVLVAISAMMVGWHGLADYMHFIFLLDKNGPFGANIAAMPNLRGLIAGWPRVNDAGGVTMSLTIVCSIAVLGIALWVVTRREFCIRFVFAVASVTSVMVSYHALTHDLTWLLPVLLLLFAAPRAGTPGEMQADTILLMVVYTIFLGSSSWLWLSPLWCVPVLIWIVLKFRSGHAAEAVA